MNRRKYSEEINVAIVDDDPRIRNLFQMIIDDEPGFRCIQTYSGCDTALQDVLQHHPDVILLDINMPDTNVTECVRRLREFNPGLEILMLSTNENSQKIYEAIKVGAIGYLIKGLPPAELLTAIREVFSGEAQINRDIAVRVANELTERNDGLLTKRENRILKLVARGESYQISAEILGITTHVVKCHIRSIYRKLELANWFYPTIAVNRNKTA